MSVYTYVSPQALDEFLLRYAVGRAVKLEGICAGIENSNFFLDTDTGSYVLTLFEKLAAPDIPYFLDLTAHLARRGIPCPQPMPDRDGHYLQHLCGKPAAIVQRLRGSSVDEPSTRQSVAVGRMLGRLHQAGRDFGLRRANPTGPHWWAETVHKLSGRLSREEQALLEDELAFQRRDRAAHRLPHGVIHADLFRDNALFEGDTLTGVIDFYYAADDLYLYDLAITANAWCSRPDGSLDATLCAALRDSYEAERPLVPGEAEHWPVVLRAAALRFWLSRLHDFHFPREGDLTHTKDPEEYRRILLMRRGGR